MTVFVTLSEEDGSVTVLARAEGPGGIVGDMRQVIEPGESFLGYSYEEWQEGGSGRRDVEPRAEPADGDVLGQALLAVYGDESLGDEQRAAAVGRIQALAADPEALRALLAGHQS